MIPTRRVLISAGVAGAILAGGVAVAATASAGRLEQARRDDQKARTITTITRLDPAQPAVIGVSPEPAGPGGVVSHEMNVDPDTIARYWTSDRLRHAEPMPIPEATLIAPSN